LEGEARGWFQDAKAADIFTNWWDFACSLQPPNFEAPTKATTQEPPIFEAPMEMATQEAHSSITDFGELTQKMSNPTITVELEFKEALKNCGEVIILQTLVINKIPRSKCE
jgi:hypothetical protein